jgi:hypothetical protein
MVNPWLILAIIQHKKTTNEGEYHCFLAPKEEIFLLSLQAEDGRRPNISCSIHELFIAYGRVASSSSIPLVQ